MTRATLLRTYAGRLRSIADMMDQAADLCTGHVTQTDYEASYIIERMARKDLDRVFDRATDAPDKNTPADLRPIPPAPLDLWYRPASDSYERAGD